MQTARPPHQVLSGLIRKAGVFFNSNKMLSVPDVPVLFRYDKGPSFWYADMPHRTTNELFRFVALDEEEYGNGEPGEETNLVVDMEKVSDFVPICFALLEETERDAQGMKTILIWPDGREDFWFIRRDEHNRIGLFHSRHSSIA